MGVHSGKFGVVNGVSTIQNWTIQETSTPPRYVASNTRYGSGRKRGIRDWSGSYTRYGGVPLHMPGEFFTLAGYTAPDNDTDGGTGVVYGGNAIVDSVVVNWNWANGEIINHVVNFSGDLALTTSSAVHSDATDPDVPEVCGAKIEFGDGTTQAELLNVVSAALTLTAENPSYSNSSTVVSGACWTGRKAGPIDWTLAIVVEDNIRTGTIPLMDDNDVWDLYIDGTDFWRLQWGITKDFTGITIDRETGAIINQTLNIEMNGFNPTVGSITLPGAGSAWWP